MTPLSTVIRRQHFHGGRLKFAVDRLPPGVRAHVGLEPEVCRRPGAVQIGTAPAVLPGYLHVALGPGHPHEEVRLPPSRPMLARQSASEIIAIGVLDTMRPHEVSAAVGYWHRALRPGGRLVVGVERSPEMEDDDEQEPVQTLWERQPGAPAGATSSLQAALGGRSKVRFNRRLLLQVLACNGIEEAGVDEFDLPPLPDAVVADSDILVIGRAR